jgi:hypothetical protein
VTFVFDADARPSLIGEGRDRRERRRIRQALRPPLFVEFPDGARISVNPPPLW